MASDASYQSNGPGIARDDQCTRKETTGTGRRVAIERWKILKGAIVAAKRGTAAQDLGQSSHNSASVRRFSSFILFTISKAQEDEEKGVQSDCVCWGQQTDQELSQPHDKPVNGMWLKYEPSAVTIAELHKSNSNATAVMVKHVTESASLEAMMGFNNTGNVCVWPSEEVLAYYCLKHSKLFEEKAVCELGCGMTGLAGVILASTQLPSQVMLTDGNETSIKNVKEILHMNCSKFGCTAASAEVLLWNDAFLQSTSPHDSQFDYVICADCLFFEEVHSHLAQVMVKLLKPTGSALLLAPGRGGTFEKFCAAAKSYFRIESSMHYDDLIWQKHREALKRFGDIGMYSVDLHYPLLLMLYPL